MRFLRAAALLIAAAGLLWAFVRWFGWCPTIAVLFAGNLAVLVYAVKVMLSLVPR